MPESLEAATGIEPMDGGRDGSGGWAGAYMTIVSLEKFD